jgi:hypothetical protein
VQFRHGPDIFKEARVSTSVKNSAATDLPVHGDRTEKTTFLKCTGQGELAGLPARQRTNFRAFAARNVGVGHVSFRAKR